MFPPECYLLSAGAGSSFGVYLGLIPVLAVMPLGLRDVRTRRVGIRELAAFGVSVVATGWADCGWRGMMRNAAENTGLLILLGILLAGYLQLRKLPFIRAVGCGDVVFLLACTPLFTPMGFLRFLIAACLVSLVWWYCLLRRRRSTVPFVGTAGIALDTLMAVVIHIPTEIVRLLSAAEAAEYRLVPFERTEGRVRCYGEAGRDYTVAIGELEALCGWQAEVVPLDGEEFHRLMLQYYRGDTVRLSATQSGCLKDIASGSGFLMSLIGEAFRDYASDIHIESYETRCRIRMRIDGKLTERYVVERAQYAPLVNQIKILANLDISEKRLPQDGRILYDRNGVKFDVRVSTLPTIYGEKTVLRLLTRHVELLELSNLGFSERQYGDYCRAVAHPFGMVLICGPTGSGKSTTLYATLRRLNRLTDNILTIEDPIEYTLEGVNQVQLKEEIGLTFTAALRTFLRQDPDIIMLGEIRDRETAEMAVRSSLTGHLLFSTIHTNTAWGAVARLTDMGVHPYLVADTLVMTVAQRLVRLLCPHCKRRAAVTDEVRRLLPDHAFGNYFEAVGCERCFFTGYAGRRAVYEVIPMDEELAAAARTGRSDITPLLAERDIASLRDAVVELFLRGETSLDELIPLLNY